MMDAANYWAVERLRDGRRLEVRAFRPGDQADLLSAVSRTSPQSLYRRFFTVKRSFSEREREFFLNVDFVGHVALMAWAEESGQKVIVGGGPYVVVQPGKAEVAFVVIDQYRARRRRGTDAPSGGHCPRSRAAGADCRGSLRERGDVEGVREERASHDNDLRVRGRASYSEVGLSCAAAATIVGAGACLRRHTRGKRDRAPCPIADLIALSKPRE